MNGPFQWRIGSKILETKLAKALLIWLNMKQFILHIHWSRSYVDTCVVQILMNGANMHLVTKITKGDQT